MTVTEIDCTMCRGGNHTLVTTHSGYLAPPEEPTQGADYTGSEVAAYDAEDCGSQRCMWRLRVPAGMQLNLSLWDFSLEGRGTAEDVPGIEACYRWVGEPTLPTQLW